MPKTRNHNEYFRPVYQKSIKGIRHRDPSLIEEILTRPANTWTREQLEAGYETIIDIVSSRKSCPYCLAKLEPDEFVWSWGEYRIGKWNTVRHFCKSCFHTTVREPLLEHAGNCGCNISLIGKGCELPSWLTIECLVGEAK